MQLIVAFLFFVFCSHVYRTRDMRRARDAAQREGCQARPESHSHTNIFIVFTLTSHSQAELEANDRMYCQVDPALRQLIEKKLGAHNGDINYGDGDGVGDGVGDGDGDGDGGGSSERANESNAVKGKATRGLMRERERERQNVNGSAVSTRGLFADIMGGDDGGVGVSNKFVGGASPLVPSCVFSAALCARNLICVLCSTLRTQSHNQYATSHPTSMICNNKDNNLTSIYRNKATMHPRFKDCGGKSPFRRRT
jgi:hypothetical protein